tara:strand:- start:6095 stop:6703 length:609 start_codon:yes stop_codon:yes gene_type:complete
MNNIQLFDKIMSNKTLSIEKDYVVGEQQKLNSTSTTLIYSKKGWLELFFDDTALTIERLGTRNEKIALKTIVPKTLITKKDFYRFKKKNKKSILKSRKKSTYESKLEKKLLKKRMKESGLMLSRKTEKHILENSFCFSENLLRSKRYFIYLENKINGQDFMIMSTFKITRESLEKNVLSLSKKEELTTAENKQIDMILEERN